MKFAITSLAVFAITYLMVYFDGPLDMLWQFRKLCGVRRIPILGIDGQRVGIVEDAPGKLAKLASCHWCLTTWVSLAITTISIRRFDILWWFACVAVSGLLHDFLKEGVYVKGRG